MSIFDLFAEEDPRPKNRRVPIDPLLKKAIIDELLKKQKGRCMYCGRKVPRDLFDLDHKNPVAQGGTNRKSNFQLLCRSCNTRKGSLTDREFRRKYREAGVPQKQILPQNVIRQDKFVEAGKGILKSTKPTTTKRRATRRAQVIHAGDILDGRPVCGGRGKTAGFLEDVTCTRCMQL